MNKENIYLQSTNVDNTTHIHTHTHTIHLKGERLRIIKKDYIPSLSLTYNYSCMLLM